MKFIGIPKTYTDTKEKVRSALSGVLLVVLVLVCIFGAESAFSSSKDSKSTEYNADSAVTADELSALAPVTTQDAELDLESRSAMISVPNMVAQDASGVSVATGITSSVTVAATSAQTVRAQASAETAEAIHYYVTAELSIRSGPGIEYEKVGSFAAGDEIDSVATTANGWKKLADGTYVISDYLSTTPPDTVVSGTRYVTGTVNVRSQPSTDSEITKTLNAGDAISVVSLTSTGWYQTVKGTYVLASLCSETAPATPTPTPTPKPVATATPKPTGTTTTTPTTTKPVTALSPEGEAAPADLSAYESMTVKVTYYGPQLRNGVYSVRTASGTTCTQGRTIATDTSVIPSGTRIYVSNDLLGGDGYYTAEDTGSGVSGNMIDLYVNDTSTVTQGGSVTIYILK